MKNMITASLVLISILDLSHDPKRVVVEACREDSSDRCARIVVPRDKLDSTETLDRLADLIRREVKEN